MRNDTDIRSERNESNGISNVQPGEYSATFWMSAAVDRQELQTVFDDYCADTKTELRCMVHQVRDFKRPDSFQFFKKSAQYWPWDRLMFPWRTNGGRVEPSIPKHIEEMWDPAHARELEASGVYKPQIIIGNAYENGRVVAHSNRELKYVFDVTVPMDEFLDAAIVFDSDKSAVPGLFLVHEQITNVMFPVTDRSVIHWSTKVQPLYRETKLEVCGRNRFLKQRG